MSQLVSVLNNARGIDDAKLVFFVLSEFVNRQVTDGYECLVIYNVCHAQI